MDWERSPMSVLHHAVEESALTFDTADAIFAANHALQIVLWNPGAEALLGFKKDEVLGTPCHELVGCPSLTRRLFCSARRESQRAGPRELVPGFDTMIAAKTGENVCVNVATILATPRRGYPLRLHVLRDIRRQKEIEELLHEVVSGASRLSFGATASATGAEGCARGAPCGWSVTGREREVIQLLAQGASTDAVAAKLGITRRTARNHIQNILSKLHVHSRLEAVAYATAKGLI